MFDQRDVTFVFDPQVLVDTTVMGGGWGYGGGSAYTRLCECGGRTGICGTPQGANAWRAHIATQRHQDWFEKSFMTKPDANKEKK